MANQKTNFQLTYDVSLLENTVTTLNSNKISKTDITTVGPYGDASMYWTNPADGSIWIWNVHLT